MSTFRLEIQWGSGYRYMLTGMYSDKEEAKRAAESELGRRVSPRAPTRTVRIYRFEEAILEDRSKRYANT